MYVKVQVDNLVVSRVTAGEPSLGEAADEVYFTVSGSDAKKAAVSKVRISPTGDPDDYWGLKAGDPPVSNVD